MKPKYQWEDGYLQGIADWVWEHRKIPEMYDGRSNDWLEGYNTAFNEMSNKE